VNWQDRENPRSGGAEIHLHEVFGRLARGGHEVTALVSGWPDAPARARLDGLDVHRTGGRHTFTYMAAVYYRRRLARQTYDLVVEDLNKVPVYTPVWSGRPVVLLVHHLFGGTAFQEASLPVAASTWLLERTLPRFYHRLPIQAVSRSTAQDLVARGFDGGQIEVIENGVELQFYSPDPSLTRFPEPTVLYLGRLKRYKRVDLVVRAVALLRDEGVWARLIIAGKGDAEGAIRALVAELNLADRVELTGFVDEQRKRELLRRSWVHVLTSPKEGWGISTMEAAACATTTVASDSPGLRDAVRHEQTGLLVPHGDVAALAAGLRRIVQDTAFRDQLGSAARSLAETYTWERTAAKTEAHLERVLALAPGRPSTR
jgi:glycosyltransferase involved in cell wall biosynthesis